MRSSDLGQQAFLEASRLMMSRYEDANRKFDESVKSGVVEAKLLEELNKSILELVRRAPRESDRRAAELTVWQKSGTQGIAGQLGFEGKHGISAGMEMNQAQAGAAEGDIASQQHLSSIRAKQFTDTFVGLKDAMLSTKFGQMQGNYMQANQAILSAVGMPLESAGLGAAAQIGQQLDKMQQEAKSENQRLGQFSGPMGVVQSRDEYKKAMRDRERGDKRAEQASMEEMMQSQVKSEQEKVEDTQYKEQGSLSYGWSYLKWMSARRQANEQAGNVGPEDNSMEDFAWEAHGAKRGEREKYLERVKDAAARGESIGNDANSWNTQQYSLADDKFDKYGRPKRLK